MAEECAATHGPLSLRYNPQQMIFYTRLRARQPSGKPGVIAVMRKLLVLCYSLWKDDCAK